MKLVIAALILPALIVLGIATLETRVLYPPPANGLTKGLVWDGRTFSSRLEFAVWLRAHGIRYAVWARRHPALSGFEPKRKTQQLAKRTAKPTGSPQMARRKTPGWSKGLGGGVAAIGALSLIILFFRRRWRPGRGWSARPLFSLGARRAPAAAEGRARRLATAAAAAEGRAHQLAGAAAAAEERAQKLASATAERSAALARTATETVQRRRSELGWYLATSLLAVGIGLFVTAWLNGA